MNYFLFYVQFGSFFFLINASGDVEQPFIFNPYTREILNWPDSTDAALNGPIVAVCPPPYAKSCEQSYNKKYSIDGKALFWKEIYSEKNVQIGDIKVRCKNKFEMAAAFYRRDTANVIIKFGFEVYAEASLILPEIIRVSSSSYRDYGPVAEAASVWEKYINKIRRQRRPHVPHPMHFDHINFEFMWVPKMKISYDVPLWSLISLKYTIYRNPTYKLNVKCNDYNLGKKFYQIKFGYFEEFYSDDNQETVFKLVKLPELPNESVCKQTLKCVTKYDLAPPYHFQMQSSSPTSCSNLTTIPIWYEIVEELLSNLEIFLTSMGQIIERKLTIIPGIYGILSFPKTEPQSKLMQKMYLNLKHKKIPIPKIIYKIVRYQSYNCKSLEELCWFNVLIVIHNQPNITKKDLLCPQDKCKPWGWDSIQYTTVNKTRVKSKHIYCCKLDETMQKRLNYKLGKNYNEDLNLRYFPYYDEEIIKGEAAIDKNNYSDMQVEFENQLKKVKAELYEFRNSHK